MGYTHYWRQEDEIADWEGFCEDMEAIVEASDVALKRFDLEDSYMVLDAVDGSESFYVTRFVEPNNFGVDPAFNFCKTRRLPYDEIVCAGLLALKDRADVEVSSDGDLEGELWREGAVLYRRCFPERDTCYDD